MSKDEIKSLLAAMLIGSSYPEVVRCLAEIAEKDRSWDSIGEAAGEECTTVLKECADKLEEISDKYFG